ncbi:NAD+ synthase [bacterium]|nr:NAD+ synthase [bacterium]
MKITLSQINPIIGDISGTINLIRSGFDQAATDNSSLVVFPELVLTGYPPRDLLNRPSFVTQVMDGVDEIVTFSKEYPLVTGIVGSPYLENDRLYNAAIVVRDGGIQSVAKKILLPHYDVFDEARYFVPGESVTTIEMDGKTWGIQICEDAWGNRGSDYSRDPVAEFSQITLDGLINLSASPYDATKPGFRKKVFTDLAKRLAYPVVMVNQVGANDELIFDGRSLVLDAAGEVVHQSEAFEASVETIDIRSSADSDRPGIEQINRIQDIANALSLGIRDYVTKSGFQKVVLGLSGGIDSAVTAALAVQALGPDNVSGVAMPSKYSSEGSVTDAKALADQLGISYQEVTITGLMAEYDPVFAQLFPGMAPDVTEENVQARIRGTILMAISNKRGSLLLTTGNKSELSVGYCTLYGDMCGALSVLGDVYKGDVYELANWINRNEALIPQSSIDKPPSAELRPDQKDEDSLPDYDVLDGILKHYLEDHLGSDEIVAKGYESSVVEWVVRTIQVTEYKRRQSPPILKISPKAFGMGRRLMIAARG